MECFILGDLVRLSGQQVIMTVLSTEERPEWTEVNCAWYDKKDNLNTFKFNSAVLIKVP